MRKKKVIQSLYSGLGGHSNVVFSLLESDFLNKYENVLVFFGVEKTLPDYVNRTNNLGIKQFSILKKRKKYRTSLRTFHNILKKEKPDVIIIHNSELIFSAVKFKKNNFDTKLIFVEHEPNHSKTYFEKLISKYSSKKADVVICLNNSYKSELLTNYRYKASLIVVPNGLDTNKYRKKNTRSEVKYIGMAARLVDTKDHERLLISFAKLLNLLPNLILKIAGDGEKYSKLVELTKSLKITDNVQFLGLLTEEKMLDFYESIDLYVHATLSETLSTSILQAMSFEHIVLTSDIENNKQIIKDGICGFTYENKNVDDLFLKMKFIIENFENCKKIGLNAREVVEKEYSNKLMSINYQNAIEK